MRKVLILIVLLFFNLLIYKGAWAVDLQRHSFSCANRNILQRVINYFSHEASYLLVLDRSTDYRQLLLKKDGLERKLKSVAILDRYGFDLVIAQQGEQYLLINNFCYNHEDAESNKKTLRFFFNLPVELVSLNAKHSFGRQPAAQHVKSKASLFLVSFE